MTSWKIYKLGDIAKFQTGKLNSNAAIENGKYPFFTCSPTTLAIDDYAFDKEAILLAGNNAEGNFSIKYFKGKFNAYQRTYIIETKNDICDIKFLFYALKICLHQFKQMSQGTSTKFLTAVILNNFEISLPSLEEQRRIAGILGAIDDKIENNRRINANLESQAQALYKQWFVDNRSDDWEKRKLESIIDIGSGKGLARIDFVEDGLYPILGANGQIGRTNNFLIDKKDNVLFTGRVGTLGNVFRLQQKRAWLSDNTLIIAPKKKYYNYVYFFLKSSNLKDFNVGSTQPLIRQSDIKEMDILIPDYLTLEAFENKCIAMFDKINQANAEIDSLATLRDTLLPKLMNGEIKIDE